jgi:peptidoglycan L-alanyl-D-glutamate endopeptidase CwlK
MSKYKLGKNSARNLETLLLSGEELSKVLINAVKDFINYTPIDFTILSNGGYRTAKLQNKQFKKGVSECDGYNIKSYHQSGLAVDLVPWVKGKATWDREHVQRLAGAFYVYLKLKGIKFVNGGDWNDDGCLVGDSWDGCHFEIKDI